MNFPHRFARAMPFLLAMPLAAPAFAQGTIEELSAPTPVDFADVREKTDALIAEIISGKAAEALRAALSENPVVAQQTSQISLVVSQNETVSAEYGKAEQCVGWKQDYISSLRIMTSYICQHRDILILWEFAADRLPKGWTYSTIRFNADF
ncbi:hypothetical protein [Erythrobacter sanguineus]|uniref:Uncharacterized protein n=1 Tax=Erythrobacter sanguineus TaxID=198312 RepID=A0A1M7RUE5_9SPHN|nr:hypothetical protein [Erythrobacter sanguineus]SHN49947.1 hypothetical protein SAMN02745193_00441 [Erythrobacter sanguineus]